MPMLFLRVWPSSSSSGKRRRRHRSDVSPVGASRCSRDAAPRSLHHPDGTRVPLRAQDKLYIERHRRASEVAGQSTSRCHCGSARQEVQKPLERERADSHTEARLLVPDLISEERAFTGAFGFGLPSPTAVGPSYPADTSRRGTVRSRPARRNSPAEYCAALSPNGAAARSARRTSRRLSSWTRMRSRRSPVPMPIRSNRVLR